MNAEGSVPIIQRQSVAQHLFHMFPAGASRAARLTHHVVATDFATPQPFAAYGAMTSKVDGHLTSFKDHQQRHSDLRRQTPNKRVPVGETVRERTHLAGGETLQQVPRPQYGYTSSSPVQALLITGLSLPSCSAPVQQAA